MIKISLEEVAANAFIYLLDKGVRFVTYATLEKYAEEAIKFLQINNIEATLVFSRNNTTNMLYEYKDFFDERENEEKQLGIYLNGRKDKDDLIATFCGYIPFDSLLALSNKEVIEKSF